MTDWHHPRIENPAESIDETDEIAEEALAAFSRRKEGYPEAIRLGRISEAAASDDLKAWREIARDWRWIAYGDGEPAGYSTLKARIKALDIAIGRLLAAADENCGILTDQQSRQGALLCAMRWWAERERHPQMQNARNLAGQAHTWRAENGHPTRGEMLRAQHPQHKNERNAA